MPIWHVFDMTCEGQPLVLRPLPPLTLTLSPFQEQGNGARERKYDCPNYAAGLAVSRSTG